MRLTSPQNPRLKLAAKLRDRRGRQRQQRIIIDGERALRHATTTGIVLEEMFLAEHPSDSLNDEQHRWLDEQSAAGTQVFTLPTRLQERIAYGHRYDQWIGTAALPDRSLAQLKLPAQPVVAILESVEKPGNVGAVLRSADAAGIDALIVADGQTDLFNPNVIRASLGTIFTMAVANAPVAEVITWLKRAAMNTYVARIDGATDYRKCDFRESCTIVLGSEADGVSADWLTNEWQGVKLPMRGHADSLNVSTTAAILFYEAMRQRHP